MEFKHSDKKTGKPTYQKLISIRNTQLKNLKQSVLCSALAKRLHGAKRELREMAFKVMEGFLDGTLPLGADSALVPRSFFGQTQKPKLQVSFWGLHIALSPNLIGSSESEFHKDSESGLNSKMEKTRSHLAKPL